MKTFFRKAHIKIKGEKGASLIEMSLIVSLIAVVGIANVTYFGDRTAAKICEGASQLEAEGNIAVRNRQWNSANRTCVPVDYQNDICPPGTIPTVAEDGSTICVLPGGGW